MLTVPEKIRTIRDLYKRYGHIQEVIIQNFCPKPGTEMANIPGASPEILMDTIKLATEILPKEISIQIPLNLAEAGRLLDSGVTDLGGVSPVTIDYINPEHPWPAIEELHKLTASAGYTLAERLCIYKKYSTPEWVDEQVFQQSENWQIKSTVKQKNLKNILVLFSTLFMKVTCIYSIRTALITPS